MIRPLSRVFAITALGGALFAVPSMVPVSPSQDSSFESQIRDQLQVFRFDTVNFDLPETQPGPQNISVELDGVNYTLDIMPHSMRADDFRLMVQGEDGEIREVQPPAPATFKGSVIEFPGSIVAGSIIRGQFTGMVLFDDGATLNIQPVSKLGIPAHTREHVAFWSTDSIPSDQWRCGLDDLGLGSKVQPKLDDLNSQGGGTYGLGTGYRLTDIAFDADVEFYNRNNASVADTLHDIENVMAGVEIAYERDVDISYELTVVIVRTAEPDPYSSSNANTLLNQFQNHWNANQGSIRRDVAHLMTGRNIDGGTIGIAYLGVVCNSSSGYGLSQSQFSGQYAQRVALTAHELGHNWNAAHCDGSANCHIMCSGLGGCNGLGAPEFGPQATSQIVSHRNSRGCLVDLGSPLSFPFFEDWETSLDLDKWSYNKGSTRSTAGLNEPSGTFSLNMDSVSANLGADDEIRSNEIQMSGVPLAKLSYYVEHRGVEAGKTLSVYYWNNDITWVLVNTITSDGVDQSNFVQYQHTLGTDALHDEFRVRFIVDGTANNDEWYVDDIAVDLGDCVFPVLYGNATPGGAGITPLINSTGVPSVGTTNFSVDGSQMYGGQTGFFFTGFAPIIGQLANGIWLNVLPPWFIIPIATTGPPLPGVGTASIPVSLPNDPSLVDLHLYFFFLTTDPLAGNGFGGTQGLDVTICE